jgi:hypothetical protein
MAGRLAAGKTSRESPSGQSPESLRKGRVIKAPPFFLIIFKVLSISIRDYFVGFPWMVMPLSMT